jgi:hypothetical protein
MVETIRIKPNTSDKIDFMLNILKNRDEVFYSKNELIDQALDLYAEYHGIAIDRTVTQTEVGMMKEVIEGRRRNNNKK